ncbi:hypothetical protein MLD38_013541 [Melastoma candidum]|uniref:Uncharacterized protein n=1 Tax=Melastoma candidum TaxID=119954 RepID=A0ACB9RA18_9MYRT|nr:hypothetical protein MLD38_013541 [Melastoma candidum]
MVPLLVKWWYSSWEQLGLGRSKLSIDLATHFEGEIINSDKIQVYEGLDEVGTNSVAYPITSWELCKTLTLILSKMSSVFTPCTRSIIVLYRSWTGAVHCRGSNSFVEALLEDTGDGFKSHYDLCFIWLDVFPSVLQGFVSRQVDEMVCLGLVDEVLGNYKEDVDYNWGIPRAIVVCEMDSYRKAGIGHDYEQKMQSLLNAAIEEIKANTCDMTYRQVGKIKEDERRAWMEYKAGRSHWCFPKVQRGSARNGKTWFWDPPQQLLPPSSAATRMSLIPTEGH